MEFQQQESSSQPPPRLTLYDYRRRRISLYHPYLHPLLLPSTTFRGLLQIQAMLTTSSLLSNTFASSRLLKRSLSFSVTHALKLLFKLSNPDSFSFNTVLDHVSFCKNTVKIFSLYTKMVKDSFFRPNSYSFMILANAAARTKNDVYVRIVHGHALVRGLISNAALPVFNSLVFAYGVCGLPEVANNMFNETSTRDSVSWNCLLSGYLEIGDLGNAKNVFDEMPEKNVVSWNAMITGYLKWRSPETSLRVLREMSFAGVQGNEKTLVSGVTACGRIGRLREGRSVHGQFVRRFSGGNVIFESALIDMYSKCKKVRRARIVFDRMHERNTISWNSMVLGHCIHGTAEYGLSLFHEMVRQGKEVDDVEKDTGTVRRLRKFCSDEVTFIGVLCACVRAGLLDEGKMYFEQMKSVYNIAPKFPHYWLMANLYGRLKLFEDAEDILKSIPGDAESLFWSSLLGLSRFRGNVEFGESVATRLIELEPDNHFHYAFLWNIYAVANRWEDVRMLKVFMTRRGLKTTPGHSLLDLSTLVDNLKVRDKLQEVIEGLCMIMGDIAANLKVKQ